MASMASLLAYFTPEYLGLLFLTILLIIIVTIFISPLSPPEVARTLSKSPLQDPASVLAVSISPEHVFFRDSVPSITLDPLLGVKNNSVSGRSVQHYSELIETASMQDAPRVQLIQFELLAELEHTLSPSDTVSGRGNQALYNIKPGDLGEHIVTAGIDLLAVGVDTRLHFINISDKNHSGNTNIMERNDHPIVTLKGLTNLHRRVLGSQKGLQEKSLLNDRRAEVFGKMPGIMGVVEVGGVVEKGAKIMVQLPEEFEELTYV
ncbi:MAG: hypothetical protein M1818_004333 [Claussenomyces sp. TS43310]|nr:MAG: hypothetical protein M1818_004333 [Claussenomyces sp. TS43310]